MPYRSKATREREKWMTLPEVIKHIRAAENCDEEDAREQLRSALADTGSADAAPDDGFRNDPDNLLLGFIMPAVIWAEGELLEDVKNRIVNNVQRPRKYTDFEPDGRRWESAEINWRDGTVKNIWTLFKPGEWRGVLVSREAIVRHWRLGGGIPDPAAHTNFVTDDEARSSLSNDAAGNAGEVPSNATLKRMRRPPGPRPGTIDRFGAQDRALFPQMEEFISQGESITGAARRLVNERRVAGTSRTDESKVRRLARRYCKEKAIRSNSLPIPPTNSDDE